MAFIRTLTVCLAVISMAAALYTGPAQVYPTVAPTKYVYPVVDMTKLHGVTESVSYPGGHVSGSVYTSVAGLGQPPSTWFVLISSVLVAVGATARVV